MKMSKGGKTKLKGHSLAMSDIKGAQNTSILRSCLQNVGEWGAFYLLIAEFFAT
jgi:hypothetical protein